MPPRADESGSNGEKRRNNQQGGYNTIVESTFDPVGAHQWFSGTAVTPLSPPNGANLLMIQPRGQNLVVTFDGTTPVVANSKGFLFVADSFPVVIPIGDNMTINAVHVAAGGVTNYQWGRL